MKKKNFLIMTLLGIALFALCYSLDINAGEGYEGAHAGEGNLPVGECIRQDSGSLGISLNPGNSYYTSCYRVDCSNGKYVKIRMVNNSNTYFFRNKNKNPYGKVYSNI